MSRKPKNSYSLLEEDESCTMVDKGSSASNTSANVRPSSMKIMLPYLLTLSLIANFACLLYYRTNSSLPSAVRSVSTYGSRLHYLQDSASYGIPSDFATANLVYDTTRVFHYHNDYWGPNETVSDQLWDQVDTSPVMVTLSQDYIQEHNLPPSIPFPWDQSRSLYYIKAFHTLHCLVSNCFLSLRATKGGAPEINAQSIHRLREKQRVHYRYRSYLSLPGLHEAKHLVQPR